VDLKENLNIFTLYISMGENMHPLAKKHFEKVLKRGNLIGSNKECNYYPCHSILEDCTWCYCPFYPCKDETLGKFIIGKNKEEIWSCEDCTWIHQKNIAQKVLNEIYGNNKLIEPLEIQMHKKTFEKKMVDKNKRKI